MAFNPFIGNPRDPYYSNYFRNYTPDELAQMAGSPEDRPFLYDLLTRARFGIGQDDFSGRYGNYISNNANLLNVLYSLGAKMGISGYAPQEGQTAFNSYTDLFNSMFRTGAGPRGSDNILGRGRDILGALLQGGDRTKSSVIPEDEMRGAVMALLSKYLPAEAVSYLFGNDNWTSLKNSYERQYGHATNAPAFINYLQQLGYIPKSAYNENVQVDQPQKQEQKPATKKPLVDEMKPGDTKMPVMNRNTGPENNPILSSQTDWENMRKQKPLKFLGAM